VDDVLVDCGPASCLPALLEGMGDWIPSALLLTHIHFDHAGAAGALVERWPDLPVLVHRRGAKHMVDPSRLVASARRVFGDDLDRLFGPMTPVPEQNLQILEGGERHGAFEVLYTPGHASHHVTYLHDDGHAFVGDVAAVRLGSDLVFPPTPPPDIDLTLWRESLAAVEQRGPTGLCLPHYGLVSDPEPYLAEVREVLTRHEELALSSSEAEYVATVSAELDEATPAGSGHDYKVVVPLDQNYAGLRRWLDLQRKE
jgi:glyoxylase-like metal-dependent hydrolase (beta-lactamase superfamily II)